MPRPCDFKFSGVKRKVLLVVGVEGGGTPGHLLLGGGLEKK